MTIVIIQKYRIYNYRILRIHAFQADSKASTLRRLAFNFQLLLSRGWLVLRLRIVAHYQWEEDSSRLDLNGLEVKRLIKQNLLISVMFKKRKDTKKIV